MRTNPLILVESLLVLLLGGVAAALSQSSSTEKRLPAPPDEDAEILKQIKEAYKAPFEVHEDVLKELRKLYDQPTAAREEKIFKELRRLYLLTPTQEATLLGEIRKAYLQPSAAGEERLFREISRAERLPEGTVPPSVQTEQARKQFLRFDLDGDGLLSAAELPDILRGERNRWDSNRDGFIDPDEYWAYYRGRLESLAEQVASGQIDLGLKRGGPVVNAAPKPTDSPRQTVFRAGSLPAGLPDWFVRLDTDHDGQIGVYEWLKSPMPLQEFLSMDLNSDGFLTPEELLRHLAQRAQSQAQDTAPGGTRSVGLSKR